jgi:predicted transcriptional regulator
MNAVAIQTELTMSSQEIAKLTGARHDNVKRTMERLAEPGVIQLTPMEEVNHKGQKVEVYLINQRDSYIVVAQIDARFTAKLVDRWLELEGITKPKAIPVERAPALFKGFYGVAKLLGLDRNAAAISANQAVLATSGQNVLALMGQTHLESESQQHWFKVTDVGAQIGLSAIEMNRVLRDAQLQHRVDETWVPTSLAEGLYRIFDVGKAHGNGTPVTQVKWRLDVLSNERVKDVLAEVLV